MLLLFSWRHVIPAPGALLREVRVSVFTVASVLPQGLHTGHVRNGTLLLRKLHLQSLYMGKRRFPLAKRREKKPTAQIPTLAHTHILPLALHRLLS